MPLLKAAVEAIGSTLLALDAHAKQVRRRALEAAHEHSKGLLSNVVSLVSRDEQLRQERSDAALAMLQTKMELVQLQKQLVQPSLTASTLTDGAVAEEAMNGGGGITRALHTISQRMLDAQLKWEAKKAHVETALARLLGGALVAQDGPRGRAGRAAAAAGRARPAHRVPQPRLLRDQPAASSA